MLKKDFWYDLPKELIAQEPADPRDSARLMVLDRKNDTPEMCWSSTILRFCLPA